MPTTSSRSRSPVRRRQPAARRSCRPTRVSSTSRSWVTQVGARRGRPGLARARRSSASSTPAGSRATCSATPSRDDTAILLALYPVALVFTAPYSEGLFLAASRLRSTSAPAGGSGRPARWQGWRWRRASSGSRSFQRCSSSPGRRCAGAASSASRRSWRCRSRRSWRWPPGTSTRSATRSRSCTRRSSGAATSSRSGPLESGWRSFRAAYHGIVHLAGVPSDFSVTSLAFENTIDFVVLVGRRCAHRRHLPPPRRRLGCLLHLPSRDRDCGAGHRRRRAAPEPAAVRARRLPALHRRRLAPPGQAPHGAARPSERWRQLPSVACVAFSRKLWVS